MRLVCSTTNTKSVEICQIVPFRLTWQCHCPLRRLVMILEKAGNTEDSSVKPQANGCRLPMLQQDNHATRPCLASQRSIAEGFVGNSSTKIDVFIQANVVYYHAFKWRSPPNYCTTFPYRKKTRKKILSGTFGEPPASVGITAVGITTVGITALETLGITAASG